MPPCFGRLAGSPISCGERIIDRCVARLRTVEAFQLLPGQHVLRIDELARAGDEHVGRHGHPVIEIAIFEVKFLREIGERIPAANVVIDRHARIPLREIVDLAVARLAPGHAAAEFAGDGEMIADRDDRLLPVRQRRRQTELRARVADQRRHRNRFAAGDRYFGRNRNASRRSCREAGRRTTYSRANPACRDSARPEATARRACPGCCWYR